MLTPVLANPHSDLKPSNLLLDAANNVKVGDFGLAKRLPSASKYATTNVGTPFYMSPEMINAAQYNEKSDIWALGCLVYELAALAPPFDASNHLSLAMKINAGKFSRIPRQYTDELHAAVAWCLRLDPARRPCVDDLERLPRLRAAMDGGPKSSRKAEPEAPAAAAAAPAAEKMAAELRAREAAVAAREKAVRVAEAQLAAREARIQERESALAARESAVAAREMAAAPAPPSVHVGGTLTSAYMAGLPATAEPVLRDYSSVEESMEDSSSHPAVLGAVRDNTAGRAVGRSKWRRPAKAGFVPSNARPVLGV